jgi:hypothetical protein
MHIKMELNRQIYSEVWGKPATWLNMATLVAQYKQGLCKARLTYSMTFKFFHMQQTALCNHINYISLQYSPKFPHTLIHWRKKQKTHDIIEPPPPSSKANRKASKCLQIFLWHNCFTSLFVGCQEGKVRSSKREKWKTLVNFRILRPLNFANKEADFQKWNGPWTMCYCSPGVAWQD